MLKRRRLLIPGGIAMVVVVALLLSWTLGAFDESSPGIRTQLVDPRLVQLDRRRDPPGFVDGRDRRLPGDGRHRERLRLWDRQRPTVCVPRAARLLYRLPGGGQRRHRSRLPEPRGGGQRSLLGAPVSYTHLTLP